MTCARREAGAQRSAPSAGSPSRPDPRPGRRRVRLSRLLPALALLLGAFGLFDAAPAEAHTLSAPSGVSVSITQEGHARVSWTKVTTPSGTSPWGYAVRFRVKDTNPNQQGNQPGEWLEREQGSTGLVLFIFTSTCNTDGNCHIDVPGSNLTAGKTYEFQASVRAAEGAGENHDHWSSSVEWTRPAAGPAAPTFDPADGATETDASKDITLSFAEAIKADDMSTPTDFTATTVKAILTLKKTGSTGDDIPFSASIDSDKDQITINPTSDLDDGPVYVAITNSWYDADGNQGKAASATFTVKTASDDASLSGLTASKSTSADGTYQSQAIGTFGSTTTSYTAQVGASITHFKLTPTVSDTNATVKAGLRGTTLATVTSGTASAAIPLGPGANIIDVEVTAEDSSTETYTVTVTRLVVPTGVSVAAGAASDGTPLIAVTFGAAPSGGWRVAMQIKTTDASWPARSFTHGVPSGVEFDTTLTTGTTSTGGTSAWRLFQKNTAYDVRLHLFHDTSGEVIPASTTEVEVTTWNVPGKPTAVSAAAGDAAGEVDVSWTAPAATGGTGATITGYKVRWRLKDKDADTAGDQPGDWNAAAGVDASASPYTATGLDGGTTYQVQVRALNGINPGSDWSDAADGTTLSNDASLSALAVTTAEAEDGTYGALTLDPPTFDPATADYAARVLNAVSHLKLTPTVNESNAAVKVGVQGGTLATVASGTASAAIAIPLGASIFKVQVTAQDGTTLTYDVTITRNAIPTNFCAKPGAHEGGPTIAIRADNPDAGAVVGVKVQVKETAASWPARGNAHDLPASASADGDALETALAACPGGSSDTKWLVTGLTAGAGYDVRAHGTDILQTPFTESTDAISVTAWTVPGAPTAVSVAAGSSSTLDATWTAPTATGGEGAAITGAKVRWRVKDTEPHTGGDQAGAWNADDGVAADSATGHAIGGLEANTAYEVQARALNGIDPGSAWSDAGTGTTDLPAGVSWQASLRVKSTASQEFGCNNGSGAAANKCSAATTLTDDDFVVDNQTYTVSRIRWLGTSNILTVELDRTPAAALKALNLCFGESTALSLAGQSGSTLTWTGTDLGWSAGDTAALSVRASCTGTAPTASTDARLGALSGSTSTDGSLFGGTLDFGTFAAATTTYTAAVANGVTHVKLTPAVSDASATVKAGLQGSTLAAVTSGQPSQAIALAVGANAIDVEVTAGDTTTKKTYTVTVTRGAAGGGPAGGGPASGVLVSNIKLVGSQTQVSSFAYAQGFTTGDSSNGYTLESIEAKVHVSGSLTPEELATIRVELWSDSSGAPGSKIGDGLTVPTSVSTGNVAFNAPAGTTLLASTPYHVVFYTTGSSLTKFSVRRDSADSEDPGAASNWSIANGSTWASSNAPSSSTSWTSYHQSVVIRVNGRAAPAAGPAPPTGLSARAGDGELYLTWRAPSGTVTGYDVHYTSAPATGAVGDNDPVSGSDPAAAWVDAGHTGTGASQSITGLANGREYRVRVRAVNAGGSGAWARRTATPTAAPPAPPPTATGTVWSAVLTANLASKSDGRAYGIGCNPQAVGPGPNFDPNPDAYCDAALTDDDFTFGGVTYKITRFDHSSTGSPQLAIVFNKVIPANLQNSLQLVFSGRTLRLADEDGRHGNASVSWWTSDPGWRVGQTVALSLEYVPPSSPLGVQGWDGYLKVLWKVSPGAEGYDVHYTASSSVGAEAPAGANPDAGWVDAGHEGTTTREDGTGLLDIEDLTNDTEYRVRVRARYAGNAASAWAFGAGTPRHRPPHALTPNANLLTGITFNDGVRDLAVEPAVANAVGFGGPEHRYQVHVPPGITSVTVTPTWSTTGTLVAVPTLRSITYGGLLSVTWSSIEDSGDSGTVNLSKGNGAYELSVSVAAGTNRGIYRFYLIHNTAWKSADARLDRLELLAE